MIVDGQCYIVIVPGMALPEGPIDGLQRWVEASYPDQSRWCDVTGDLSPYTYRYPVTESEYKAHHWCLAHGVSVPEGYEVLRFGRYFESYATDGLYGLTVGAGASTNNWGMATTPRPILRKKACEHKLFVANYEGSNTSIRCKSCGMVRKLGDWERGASNV